ncbi:MAG TPA: galactose-1-phosphate uridylyltransferase [Bryobacteraceae bacterium]
MHQLRWHALLRQWVVFNTNRQNRPQMPANWCPFDPGSGKVPDHYDVHLYPNDFPGFSPLADPFDPAAEPAPFDETGPRGACDVVLYSPEHTLPPSKLTVENWRKVISLWVKRTAEHAANPDIAMVAVFENCGDAVGVTMPHPHGQIYAMPFLSPVVEKEIESLRRHGGECLICYLLAEELRQQSRIVSSNEHFVAYVPFAARFPSEIWITARRHVRTLLELTGAELDSLAQIISVVRRKYDNLYGFMLPLMMAVKQAPLQDQEAPYHFHIQFLPLQRSATKLKYLATIETGYGTFLADIAPEEMAATLRNCDPET